MKAIIQKAAIFFISFILLGNIFLQNLYAVIGDIDGNGSIELRDAILGLKVLSGLNPTDDMSTSADANADQKIGLEEIVCTLQIVSQIRDEQFFYIKNKTIIIDGNMDDWNDIEPILVDNINDKNVMANFDGTDIHKIFLAKDGNFLYIGMTLNDGNPKTDIHTQYGFEVKQVYQGSTAGDHLAKAGFMNGKWYAGVHVRGSGDIADYSSDYVGVGTKFIEWKVLLSDMEDLYRKYPFGYTHVFQQNPPEYTVSDSVIGNIRFVAN